MNRRDLLKKGCLAAGASFIPSAPYGFVKKSYHLRILGTHVTLQEEIRKQAQKDLGITLSFHPGGSASVLFNAKCPMPIV